MTYGSKKITKSFGGKNIFSLKETKSFGGKTVSKKKWALLKAVWYLVKKNNLKSFGRKTFALEKRVCAFEWGLISSRKII